MPSSNRGPKRFRDAEKDDALKLLNKVERERIESCLQKMKENDAKRQRSGSIDEARAALGGAADAAFGNVPRSVAADDAAMQVEPPKKIGLVKQTMVKNKKKKKLRRAQALAKVKRPGSLVGFAG
jgi:hypothetical protein